VRSRGKGENRCGAEGRKRIGEEQREGREYVWSRGKGGNREEQREER
jgi:hypothetical protein